MTSILKAAMLELWTVLYVTPTATRSASSLQITIPKAALGDETLLSTTKLPLAT
jgi:hypothetical protein